MKTIGLIGGMSWESSLEYYRILNETVKERLGGLHSAKCILYSVDFAEIEELQHAGHWDEAAHKMVEAGLSLQRAGADLLVLCTNTMHKLAGDIEAGVDLPLLHIADTAAEAVKAAGFSRVGLLGTKFTMEQDFYRGRLTDQHGLQVLIPSAEDRELVHRVIYGELCLGVITQESRREFAQIIAKLAATGAQGVILGCTEIENLVRQQDSLVPVFPTTHIHAQAAVDWALNQ
ncbi:MAG: aspartate/glutamate racemase family protein [Anaerolineaceae bacterium]|jgi:aspartate racemase